MKPETIQKHGLEKYRRKLGMTQEELAKELEVTVRTIYNKEHPGNEKKHQISRLLAYAIIGLQLCKK